MRQTLGFIAVWCGATVLAVSVAWFGVRDVLRSEVFEDAGVGSLNAAVGRTGEGEPPPGAPTGPPDVTAPSTPSTPSTSSTSPASSGRTPAPGPASSASRSAGPRPARSPSTGGASPERTRRAGARPGASTAPAAPARPTAPAASPSRSGRAAGASSPAAPAPAATGTGSISTENLRVMNVKGGSVSFAIEDGVCRLITAAPRAGYEAKVASATGWIRVDLVRGAHGSAVFCIGAEGRTDLWEY